MTLALTEDHRALADVARSFLAERGALASARELLEAPEEKLPAFWDELCGLGWPGLHVPEASGGQGYGLAELAIVVEELGRVVAPGPFTAATTGLGNSAMASIRRLAPRSDRRRCSGSS